MEKKKPGPKPSGKPRRIHRGITLTPAHDEWLRKNGNAAGHIQEGLNIIIEIQEQLKAQKK